MLSVHGAKWHLDSARTHTINTKLSETQQLFAVLSTQKGLSWTFSLILVPPSVISKLT